MYYLDGIYFKVLKKLYQDHKEKSASGLQKNSITEQVIFLDEKTIDNVLSDFVEKGFVKLVKGVYSITQEGIEYYEKIRDNNLEGSSSTTTMEGNNTSNSPYSTNYYYNNYIYIRSKASTLGSSEKEIEFVKIYEELLKMVSEVEDLVQDAPKGKIILEKLMKMQKLIGLSRSEINKNPEWADRLEGLFGEIKEKFKKKS